MSRQVSGFTGGLFSRLFASAAVLPFTLSVKNSSIYYELTNPRELRAIEITDDLYRAKFYYSVGIIERDNISYEITEEHRRIRGAVSSAINPPLPEIGHVASDPQCTESYGMSDYSVMPSCNREHIERTVCISEQFHPLEWILTKARNSEILPNELYERIRIDVRHRALQLREISRANRNASQQMLDEVREKYSPDTNFKRITTSSDTNEFSGQVIAYLSNSYYFSNGDNAITLPVEVSGHKVRFAKVREHYSRWQGGESGYDMDCFLKPEACGSTQALINSQISADSALAMRLATVQELEFLKQTLELDQGRLGFREKEKDIRMLSERISRASSRSTGLLEDVALSQPSFIIGRTSAVIPPFTPCVTGVVDWTRASENRDKSVSPKPSKVYLIKGGDEESRKEKAYDLARQDGFAMYAVYHNKDKSEYAVVFSCEHDTFNLMNFDRAKEFAGQQELPGNFSTSIFGRGEARFGVISISNAPRFRF